MVATSQLMSGDASVFFNLFSIIRSNLFFIDYSLHQTITIERALTLSHCSGMFDLSSLALSTSEDSVMAGNLCFNITQARITHFDCISIKNFM